MILYPDQRIEEQPENDTCVFAAPLEATEWVHLHARGVKNELKQTGMRYVMFEDDGGEVTSVYFMRNFAETTDKVCILLRGNEDADTCLESAAWIRISENYPGMIYICQSSINADKWQRHNATLGAPQELVCMVDYDIPTQENDT